MAHEYPDFYVRDAILGRRVRIEMKAVDADSEEQAARFDVLSSLIHETDVVVLIGWEWHNHILQNGTNCEYPEIFSFVVVPASELAKERDHSVILRGGRIESDRIMVRSKISGESLLRIRATQAKYCALFINHVKLNRLTYRFLSLSIYSLRIPLSSVSTPSERLWHKVKVSRVVRARNRKNHKRS